jgi:hypothetical protein
VCARRQQVIAFLLRHGDRPTEVAITLMFECERT